MVSFFLKNQFIWLTFSRRIFAMAVAQLPLPITPTLFDFTFMPVFLPNAKIRRMLNINPYSMKCCNFYHIKDRYNCIQFIKYHEFGWGLLFMALVVGIKRV